MLKKKNSDLVSQFLADEIPAGGVLLLQAPAQELRCPRVQEALHLLQSKHGRHIVFLHPLQHNRRNNNSGIF